MHDAIVPAAPPDSKLYSFNLDAVMVRLATTAEPPRALVTGVDEDDFPTPPPLIAKVSDSN